MGLYFVCVFLGVFALAIGSAVIRRKLNPYLEVGNAELRTELERVMPEFQQREARAEVDRVLGKERAAFELRRVLTGTAGDEPHFEVKGRAGDWKWEVAVTGRGRLLEVEKERRRA